MFKNIANRLKVLVFFFHMKNVCVCAPHWEINQLTLANSSGNGADYVDKKKKKEGR